MKAVHWQVPFASLKGVQYRVDIYADGACDSPVVLMGGATPFVTDEDNSDDYFAPVRSQTGNLTVIDEDGTLMEALMPKDNIDRPVRLVEVKSATGESVNRVVWQGFLSCEAYSQDYTARAQELTLNVNSVLAAMESVQMPTEMEGFMTIGALINDILLYMHEKGGAVSEYYLPINSIGIINKYIDTTVLFDQKEQDNENSVTYTVSGMSMKEVLGRICTYMGWTLRENGDKLYFTDADNTHGMRRYYFIGEVKPSGEVVNKYIVEPNTSYRTIVDQMSAQEWRGTGHEIELRQGAKSVEVVAKVDEYQMNLTLDEVPDGDLVINPESRWSAKGKVIINKNATHSNLTHYKSHQVLVTVPDGDLSVNKVSYTLEHVYNSIRYTDSNFWKSVEFFEKYNELIVNHTLKGTTRLYCSAFLGKWKQKSTDEDEEEKYDEGLIVAGIPYALPYGWNQYYPRILYDMTDSNYVYSQETLLNFAATNGKLVLEFDIGRFQSKDGEGMGANLYAYVAVKFAGKWWDETNKEWTDTFTTFGIKKQKGKTPDKIEMPITEYMNGTAAFYVYPYISGQYLDACPTTEIMITKFGISYDDCIGADSTYSDRSENHYFKLMELNFSDEVSVNTDIASDLNNKPSPSIIMNSDTEPMTTLTYADGTSERPEKHLLGRLAAYYGAVRRKITLEIERPSTALPMVKVTGYPKDKDADGHVRTYLPLSESRDWRTDTSTVTMFETPN